MQIKTNTKKDKQLRSNWIFCRMDKFQLVLISIPLKYFLFFFILGSGWQHGHILFSEKWLRATEWPTTEWWMKFSFVFPSFSYLDEIIMHLLLLFWHVSILFHQICCSFSEKNKCKTYAILLRSDQWFSVLFYFEMDFLCFELLVPMMFGGGKMISKENSFKL